MKTLVKNNLNGLILYIYIYIYISKLVVWLENNIYEYVCVGRVYVCVYVWENLQT